MTRKTLAATLGIRGIAPSIARNTSTGGHSTVPRAVARAGDCSISQKIRKLIEQGIGYIKTIGGPRKLSMVGTSAVRDWITWAFAAYNLIGLGCSSGG
ncbi:hypothetical protein [Rhodanobacter hydrolyticus]|uniref:Transposase DDE domain-containing protein n=1 Tax=Rhodanobacter hydrolyticus TaxID=2250595 RepID=A0ABW8JDF9_9GAMM